MVTHKGYQYNRFVVFAAIALTGCIDSYNPKATSEDLKYLVVDALLNTTDSTCTVKLTRTNPIYATNQFSDEVNAKVIVEEKDGNVYELTEIKPGTYYIAKLHADTQKKYGLKIITTEGEAYSSAFVDVQQTPPIDTISWGYERNGIVFYLNTHDDQEKSKFYRWKVSETWIFLAAYYSSLKIDRGEIVDRPTNEQIYSCWKSALSTDIKITTTAGLQKDSIIDFKINFIPWASAKLDKRYSMEVIQYAISKDEYEYWGQLKKNTDGIGTIFAAQPSRISGNIICTSNPNQLALGYFSAGSVQRKRIFVNGRDLNKPPGITGYESCEMGFVKVGGSFGANIPLDAVSVAGQLLGYNVSTSQCVDCRLSGGTTIRPDFWK